MGSVVEAVERRRYRTTKATFVPILSFGLAARFAKPDREFCKGFPRQLFNPGRQVSASRIQLL